MNQTRQTTSNIIERWYQSDEHYLKSPALYITLCCHEFQQRSILLHVSSVDEIEKQAENQHKFIVSSYQMYLRETLK